MQTKPGYKLVALWESPRKTNRVELYKADGSGYYYRSTVPGFDGYVGNDLTLAQAVDWTERYVAGNWKRSEVQS